MARKSDDAEKHTETSKEIKALLGKVKTPTASPVKPSGVPGLPSGTTGTKAAAEAAASRAASKAK